MITAVIWHDIHMVLKMYSGAQKSETICENVSFLHFTAKTFIGMAN